MSELFSEEWVQSLGNAWNDDPQIVDPLLKADFTANISYGFLGDKHPKCLLCIVNGKIINASAYHGEKLDWDLRAHIDDWNKWITKGFGLTTLGPAVATKKLQFVHGDYRQMIRNPLLSRPFLRHFALMAKLDTTF